jgi:hypothetical protein
MLERRIARLERLLKNEAGRRRSSVPELEANLDVAAAYEAADIIARQFAKMINADIKLVKTEDIIDSPVHGWLTADDVDEIRDDEDARFAIQYNVRGNPAFSGYTIVAVPSENTVALVTEDGGSVFPDGSSYDEYELHYFPLSKWKNFNSSMLRDEEFESVKRSRKRFVRR